MARKTSLTYSMPLEVYLQAAVVRGIFVANQDRLSNYLILRKGEEIFSLKDATLESFDRKPVNIASDEYVIYMQEGYLIADLSPQEEMRRAGMEKFSVQKETSKALISLGRTWATFTRFPVVLCTICPPKDSVFPGDRGSDDGAE